MPSHSNHEALRLSGDEVEREPHHHSRHVFFKIFYDNHHHKKLHHHHIEHRPLWSRIMSLVRSRQEENDAVKGEQPDAADNNASPRGQSPADDGNAIDPATGLSRRQKDLVQQSWQHVRKDLRAAGLGFFAAFFKAHPEYQRMFRAFADVPVDQLAESASFRAHAMNVMNAVSLVVDSLDNPTKLVGELKRLGHSHGRNGIEHIHFRNLTVVLVAFLGDALGTEIFTEEVKDSWIKALDVVVCVVATGLGGQ